MSKWSSVKYLHWSMYVINFIIITFIALIIYSTSHEICDSFRARSFLEEAKYLPMIPWKVPVYAMGCFVLLGLSNLLKGYVSQNASWFLIVLFIGDILLCGFITYSINFSYTGLYLILIASIFLYIPNLGAKIFFLAIALGSFILLDYDMMTVKTNVVSFQDYINFYNTGARLYLYGIKNILDSLNQVFFIIFFSLLIQNKITENKQYIALNNMLIEKVEELNVANKKLEVLTEESAQMAKMKERNRLAREIHDILGHSLTSIITGLDACISLLDIDLEIAKKQLFKIREIGQKGLVDVRRSVRELKIDTIQKYDFIPAIENLIEELNTLSSAHINLEITGQVLKMKDDEEQTIYRIIQESLTNAIRHGKAAYITVQLSFTYHELDLLIKDDGIGCDAIEKGFGLTHIEERVHMLNGQVIFNTRESEGFATHVVIPIRWGNAYD
ncbi:sensor histidine kinase [Cellulosilyticum sp. I15G10I2]|uniref:sensor histidine kinase n=1 Tax=Cellulosilyticum sp. I15G10I2 TaxID=1892843 RepID=UPI00085C7ABF|nr:sensor histidine kinase [Cellulosilyticum sp. I15G10I2]